MKFQATEGNGGAPIVLERGKLEAPDIPRGSMIVFVRGHSERVPPDSITFDVETATHILTYHDIQVIRMNGFAEFLVFVGPMDVVEWVKRD